MAKYDGLIIPRSYSDYLNKTDGATLSQMLDSIGGTFDASPTPNSVKPARSGGIFAANAVITSDNTTLTGVTISERSVVRVLFTANLTGSDATTGLTLTYNGTAYAVKVGKDGALKALTAHLVEESYIYLQAYTTLELAFDGSQFIVMGNPVVISNADFCIMADGLITYPIWDYYKFGTSGYIDFDGVTTKDLHCVEGNLIVVKTTVYIIQNFWSSIYLGTYLGNKSILGFQNKLPSIPANTMLLCIARTLSTGDGYLDVVCKL